jgi:hypothetical protein
MANLKKSKGKKGILWVSLNEQSPPVPPRFSELPKHFHVTLAFNCLEESYKDLIGKGVEIAVNSDCYDQNIQALSVSLPSEVAALCENPNPHVTISMCEGVRPVESNRMLSSDHSFSGRVPNTLHGKVEFHSF